MNGKLVGLLGRSGDGAYGLCNVEGQEGRLDSWYLSPDRACSYSESDMSD